LIPRHSSAPTPESEQLPHLSNPLLWLSHSHAVAARPRACDVEKFVAPNPTDAYSHLYDHNGKPMDLNAGILDAIAKLGPHQSTLIEGVLGLSRTAEDYRSAKVAAKLNLGQPDHPEKGLPIQEHALEVRVSQAYLRQRSPEHCLRDRELSRGRPNERS
jgi:hypothetical protein